MYHFLLFTFLTTLLLRHQVSACMHYTATFPYSTSLPFEVTLSDNGVVTCWLSLTYDRHNRQQIALSEHHHAKPARRTQISLTKEPDLSDSSSPVRTGNGGMGGSSEQEGNTDEEDGMGMWLPWEFQCLDGYEAHAGIGLRSVDYKAHGQTFSFVPDVEEDILGERWIYELDLWCDT